jgi:hypothetical protein
MRGVVSAIARKVQATRHWLTTAAEVRRRRSD